MFSIKSPKSNKIYWLHSKLVELRSGKKQVIFYFSSIKEGSIDKVPTGYEVIFNQRTGLPMLRKIK